MKKTAKAFTLVEMLIVIVIIGILIASLMPRMQSAQGRARDVARKNDLSQIQTAIITSQADRGAWPGMVGNTGISITGTTGAANAANDGISVSSIGKNLQNAGMTAIPSDPNGSNDTHGLGTFSGGAAANLGQYVYMVGKRNGVSNAGFALMAKTEVEGSSNWVVCDGATTSGQGLLKSTDDLAHVTLCSTVTLDASTCVSNTRDCKYKETADLRYLLLY